MKKLFESEAPRLLCLN